MRIGLVFNSINTSIIDKLLSIKEKMLDLEWRIVVVCELVSKRKILKIREDVYGLYNHLSVITTENWKISHILGG